MRASFGRLDWPPQSLRLSTRGATGSMTFADAAGGRRSGGEGAGGMETAEGRRLTRVATAVVAGQAIEYYDFLLYGSAAALVLGPVFFPAADGRASTAAAFATFAIG